MGLHDIRECVDMFKIYEEKYNGQKPNATPFPCLYAFKKPLPEKKKIPMEFVVSAVKKFQNICVYIFILFT